MSETWEQTKARLRKQGIVGTSTPVVVIPPPEPDAERVEPPVKRFNVHRRSLPVGIDKKVVFNVTRAEGEWWIENKLKARIYEDDEAETKTVIYYDLVPVDATPRERNLYSNPERFCTEDFPEFKSPRRIN